MKHYQAAKYRLKIASEKSYPSKELPEGRLVYDFKQTKDEKNLKEHKISTDSYIEPRIVPFIQKALRDNGIYTNRPVSARIKLTVEEEIVDNNTKNVVIDGWVDIDVYQAKTHNLYSQDGDWVTITQYDPYFKIVQKNTRLNVQRILKQILQDMPKDISRDADYIKQVLSRGLDPINEENYQGQNMPSTDQEKNLEETQEYEITEDDIIEKL